MGMTPPVSPDREELEAKVRAIRYEVRRRRWLAAPDVWTRERLDEHIWSKQIEIMRSVRDNRRTAVPSCHNTGKSFISARIACWWIDSHPLGEALVVTTAASASQVETILWKELGRAHAKGKLPGRTTTTKWHVVMPNGNEELVAFGRKPADDNPTAFVGQHARFVLVIMDEACGIKGGTSDDPNSLWEAADSLISNEDSRILAIGNPDNPVSEFHEVCKPGSGWHVIHISAFDSPNFTGEPIPDKLKRLLIGPTYVEEKKRKWGEKNPIYVSKVLGKFPDVTKDGLIPVSWIMDAKTEARKLKLTPKNDLERRDSEAWPNELGVDVGGGGNENVVAHRHGPFAKIHRKDKESNTMTSTGNLIHDIRTTGATRAKVDEIGIGKGMADRGREIGAPIVGVNVGRPARDSEQYANIRAEAYWGLRERFQEGRIWFPDDDEHEDLQAQLCDLKFKRSSNGRILIESKEEMAKRGKPSPNDADALMLAFIPDEMIRGSNVGEVEVLWG